MLLKFVDIIIVVVEYCVERSKFLVWFGICLSFLILNFYFFILEGGNIFKCVVVVCFCMVDDEVVE